MGLLLALLLIAGPFISLALLLILSKRFYKLSFLDGLMGRARTMRLAWLVLLASGIAFIFYLTFVLFLTPIPTLKTSGHSAWRRGYEHSTIVVLFVGVFVSLLLLRRPAQRSAGISFGYVRVGHTVVSDRISGL